MIIHDLFQQEFSVLVGFSLGVTSTQCFPSLLKIVMGALNGQEALFPDGIVYDSEKGFLNPPMSEAFNLLKVLNASEFDLVAETELRLNHILMWIRGFADVEKGCN